MELLRHNKDAWGQSMLVGVSWELLWIPFVAALAVIIVHQLLRLRRRKVAQAHDAVKSQSDHAAIKN